LVLWSLAWPAAAAEDRTGGASATASATSSGGAPGNTGRDRIGNPKRWASTKIKPLEHDDLENELIEQREDYLATLRGFESVKTFDYSARVRAILQMQNQQLQQRRRDPAGTLSLPPAWVELGPAPIPNGQTQTFVRPVSGRVTAIEVDPADPNKVYVGTAQGGVYRSLDGGTTWTPLLDGALSLAIGALALDAANGRLYVGTGEANGSLDSFGGVGIYRVDSVNSTATLVGPINPVRSYLDGSSNPVSAAVFTGRSISKILIVPNDPTTIFVGTAGGVIGIGGDLPFNGTIPPLGLRGLYKLTNANGAPASVGVLRIGVRSGSGIEGCFDTPCTGNRNINDMVFDPGDVTGNTLMVWLNGTNVANDGGIWRTTNALAATPAFTQSFATTATSTSNGRGALAIYKDGASAVVYTASGEPVSGTLCADGNQSGALRRSTDGGVTFGAKLAGGGGFCDGQCFYNIALAVLPGATTATSDDKILLGGNVRGAGTPSTCQKLQSTSLNGGATTFSDNDAGLHADSHALAVAPSNTQVVYRGDDGGIWKSIDGGATWGSLNNATFRATQFSGISVHPTDPNFSIGGTQDNGTNQLLPSGAVWNRIDFGDGGFTDIDQNATDTATVTMYHTYFNQTNNLIGFARVDTVAAAFDGNWGFFGCNGVSGNGITCGDTVNFYAPTTLGPGNPNTHYFGSDRLYRSTNKGVNNTVVSQAPITAGVPISSIAVASQDDNYRFVGLRNGGLFYTTTGSSTLTSLDPVGGASVVPDKYVGRVIFDPSNKNTAYIGLGGYMAGTTAALSHVWKVTNLGTTPVLTAINGSGVTGLPDVPVNALAVDPQQPLQIFVGTDIGVYISQDGGATWNPYGTGLPYLAVFGMAVQNVKRVVRIATHGRGMWEAPVPQTAAVTISDTGVFATDNDSTVNGICTINSAVQGTTVTFTQVVKNTGNGTDAFDITVPTNSFPGGTVFSLYKSDGVTPLADTSGNSVPDTGPVAAGASYTVIIKAALPAAATGGPFNATIVSTSTAAGAVNAGTNASMTDRLLTITVSMPTVTAINPNFGPIAGGTAVTITGTSFTGATNVTLGGIAATGVVVQDSMTITATTPAHGAGIVDVAVTTPGGTGTGIGLFNYQVGAPCTYALSPLDLSNVAKTGGTFIVTVTTPSGCPVVAISYQPWVSVNSVIPSGGTTAVSLQVSSNAAAARATSIQVADRLYLITQQPGP
jgi:hypothetical protein